MRGFESHFVISVPSRVLIAFSELEIGLANHDVDLVVHSLKDLPSTLPENMVIGAIMERVDPRDTVIMKKCLQQSRLNNQNEIKLPETLNDLPKS